MGILSSFLKKAGKDVDLGDALRYLKGEKPTFEPNAGNYFAVDAAGAAEKIAPFYKAPTREGGFLYQTGLTKTPKNIRTDISKLENLALNRGSLGGSMTRKLNPLISPAKGRITVPRAAAGLAALPIAGIAGLNILNNQADASGLSQDEIDYLNQQNLLGEVTRAKSQFAPSEEYYNEMQMYIDALTKKANQMATSGGGGGATPDVTSELKALAGQTQAGMAGAAAQGTQGSVSSMLPPSAEAITAPKDVSQASQILSRYINDTNQANNLSGAIANLDKQQMKDLATQLQFSMIQQRASDQQQAESDWRKMLIKNPDYATTIAQSAQQFTNKQDKVKLQDVYDQWSKLTPKDIEVLARKGIYTPADLYLELVQGG
jgi:hypothetical protein